MLIADGYRVIGPTAGDSAIELAEISSGADLPAGWGFLLTELPCGRTRLVISGYQVARPRWIERFTNYWLYIPVVWPMQARMLTVLKWNIEKSAKAPQQTASAETTA